MEKGGERRGFSVKVLDARLRHLDCGELWMVFDGWTETETVWQRGLGFMRAEEVGTGGRGIRTGIRPESSLYLHLLPMWVLSTVQSHSFATSWTVAHQAPLFMGFFQARILEWVAIPHSRVSS